MAHPDEQFTPPDELTLRRLQLLGHLAAAARLALEDCEPASSLDLAVIASSQRLQVECTYYVNGQPIGGWGQ